MNLTYELTDNGYKLLKDGVLWVEQIGFFPYKGATLEESAQNHITHLLEDAEKNVSHTSELNTLKAQVEMQEQAITELSIYIATLGI